MEPFFKKVVQLQAIIGIGLCILGTSRPAFAEESEVSDEEMNSCQLECSNYKGSTEYSSDSQMAYQCQALEESEKAKTIEKLLMAIDGAAASSCTLACGLSLGLAAASPTSAFAIAACDRIGTADGVADLVGQIAQEGHLSMESAMNAIIMISGIHGMSSGGKK